MKGFFIKQLDTSFIVFNKAGSLLFINTFYKFCKLKNFDFENLDSNKFSELKSNDTKFIFIVRNPYERFLSCFWRWFLEKNYWGNIPEESVLLQMQRFIDSEFDYFISNYFKIIDDKKDNHLAPQKYQLLESEFDKIFTINNRYIENKYGKNYSFIKLEDLDNAFKSISERRSPYEYIDKINYTFKGFKIEYFQNWELLDLFLLSDVYFGTYNQLKNQHHHLNKNIYVSDKNNKKIKEMLNDELVFYQYEQVKRSLI
jgi:hypothetical protein